MQFTLPLYSRLFYIVGGSDVFLFVFCIGFFQSFVILILGISRAIIMSGKLFPVKIKKIAIGCYCVQKGSATMCATASILVVSSEIVNLVFCVNTLDIIMNQP